VIDLPSSACPYIELNSLVLKLESAVEVPYCWHVIFVAAETGEAYCFVCL
jgi:hypothetical protein